MQPVPRPSLDLLFWGKRMPRILLRLELEASALKCNEQKAGRPRFIFVYVNFIIICINNYYCINNNNTMLSS